MRFLIMLVAGFGVAVVGLEGRYEKAGNQAKGSLVKGRVTEYMDKGVTDRGEGFGWESGDESDRWTIASAEGDETEVKERPQSMKGTEQARKGDKSAEWDQIEPREGPRSTKGAGRATRSSNSDVWDQSKTQKKLQNTEETEQKPGSDNSAQGKQLFRSANNPSDKWTSGGNNDAVWGQIKTKKKLHNLEEPERKPRSDNSILGTPTQGKQTFPWSADNTNNNWTSESDNSAVWDRSVLEKKLQNMKQAGRKPERDDSTVSIAQTQGQDSSWFANSINNKRTPGSDNSAERDKTMPEKKLHNTAEADWMGVSENATLGMMLFPWFSNNSNNNTEGSTQTESWSGNESNNLTFGDKIKRFIGLGNFTTAKKENRAPGDNRTQPNQIVPGPGPGEASGGLQGQGKQANVTVSQPEHHKAQPNQSVPGPVGMPGGLQRQEQQTNGTDWRPKHNETQANQSVPGPVGMPGGLQRQEQQINSTDSPPKHQETQANQSVPGPAGMPGGLQRQEQQANGTDLPSKHNETHANQSVPGPAGMPGKLQGQEQLTNGSVGPPAHNTTQPNQSAPRPNGMSASPTSGHDRPSSQHATQPNQNMPRPNGMSGELQGQGKQSNDTVLEAELPNKRHVHRGSGPPRKSEKYPAYKEHRSMSGNAAWDTESLNERQINEESQVPRQTIKHKADKWIQTSSNAAVWDAGSSANHTKHERLRAPLDSRPNPAYKGPHNSHGNGYISSQYSAYKRFLSNSTPGVWDAESRTNPTEHESLQEPGKPRVHPTHKEGPDSPGQSSVNRQHRVNTGPQNTHNETAEPPTNNIEQEKFQIPVNSRLQPAYKDLRSNPFNRSVPRQYRATKGPCGIPRNTKREASSPTDTTDHNRLQVLTNARLQVRTDALIRPRCKGIRNNTVRHSNNIPLPGRAKLNDSGYKGTINSSPNTHFNIPLHGETRLSKQEHSKGVTYNNKQPYDIPLPREPKQSDSLKKRIRSNSNTHFQSIPLPLEHTSHKTESNGIRTNSNTVSQDTPLPGEMKRPKQQADKGTANNNDHSRDVPLPGEHQVPISPYKGINNNPSAHAQDIPLPGDHTQIKPGKDSTLHPKHKGISMDTLLPGEPQLPESFNTAGKPMNHNRIQRRRVPDAQMLETQRTVDNKLPEESKCPKKLQIKVPTGSEALVSSAPKKVHPNESLAGPQNMSNKVEAKGKVQKHPDRHEIKVPQDSKATVSSGPNKFSPVESSGERQKTSDRAEAKIPKDREAPVTPSGSKPQVAESFLEFPSRSDIVKTEVPKDREASFSSKPSIPSELHPTGSFTEHKSTTSKHREVTEGRAERKAFIPRDPSKLQTVESFVKLQNKTGRGAVVINNITVLENILIPKNVTLIRNMNEQSNKTGHQEPGNKELRDQLRKELMQLQKPEMTGQELQEKEPKEETYDRRLRNKKLTGKEGGKPEMTEGQKLEGREEFKEKEEILKKEFKGKKLQKKELKGATGSPIQPNGQPEHTPHSQVKFEVLPGQTPQTQAMPIPRQPQYGSALPPQEGSALPPQSELAAPPQHRSASSPQSKSAHQHPASKQRGVLTSVSAPANHTAPHRNTTAFTTFVDGNDGGGGGGAGNIVLPHNITVVVNEGDER